MRLLMPIGVVLIVIGMAGSVASCYGNSIFESDHTATVASQQNKQTDSPAGTAADESPRLYLAPLAGLAFAAGLGCVGIGMGHWRRPVPSDVRPANPWSDQPGEHGEPPRGLV